jgi:CheY-like chemotaxis protein
MKPLRLLAIDDYAPARYAHSRVLREAGFNVYEAEDGYTGLALAQLHLPDIVLLDLNLPDIHGFEVCERLKAQRLTEKICGIHITATLRGDQYRRQSIAAGADLYIEEPIASEELVRAVQSLASKVNPES